MAESKQRGQAMVEHAVDRAHDWARDLGPFWISVFDQFHGDVRRWAEEVGVDPLSYEFMATWYVACRALKRVVEVMPTHPTLQPRLNRITDIVATAGMWGQTVARAGAAS